MKFTIPANKVPEVRRELSRLARNAETYEIPVTYAMSDEHPQIVPVLDTDPETEMPVAVGYYTIDAVDVVMDCEKLISANGWTVRAMAGYDEDGDTVITTFDDCQADPHLLMRVLGCDYCHRRHFDDTTYICDHEAGFVHRVIGNCLKADTGISAFTVRIRADIQKLTERSAIRMPEEVAPPTHKYEVENILAHACDAIRESGYRTDGMRGSTRDVVTARVLSDIDPSAEGLEQAAVVRSWLTGLDRSFREYDIARGAAREKLEMMRNHANWEAYRTMRDPRTTVSSLERGCIPYALAGYALPHRIGQLAYMPLAYERYLQRMQG